MGLRSGKAVACVRELLTGGHAGERVNFRTDGRLAFRTDVAYVRAFSAPKMLHAPGGHKGSLFVSNGVVSLCFQPEERSLCFQRAGVSLCFQTGNVLWRRRRRGESKTSTRAWWVFPFFVLSGLGQAQVVARSASLRGCGAARRRRLSCSQRGEWSLPTRGRMWGAPLIPVPRSRSVSNIARWSKSARQRTTAFQRRFPGKPPYTTV